MKYLKKWKLFESVDELVIHSLCEEYDIENYTINNDGSIDVDRDVNLIDKGLTKLPLNFNHISGDFNCQVNKLTSLEGAPKEVDGDFYCSYNQLTSLKGAPEYVGGDFSCSNNQLTSLEGAPLSVGGDFTCFDNQLMNLYHLPEVSGNIYMENNPVYSIVKDWIQEPERRWERWEYFQDLNIIQGDRVILERLEEFHEVMEIPMPDLNEIKKYYKIIE